MNIYYLTKCPNCKGHITMPWDGSADEEDRFMVHGAENLEKAIIMLTTQGMTVPEVAHKFCGYCGGLLPCGCSSPTPQLPHRD